MFPLDDTRIYLIARERMQRYIRDINTRDATHRNWVWPNLKATRWATWLLYRFGHLLVRVGTQMEKLAASKKERTDLVAQSIRR